ncbi:FitA-like ribbon-helix-helix domain-containing protein [Sandarakinorhabdus sp.]|uniref:FitA-like ribbon-helix-helix domain-containing protein n=1 Tax=Sandarakinorhabdus sp. TaxID=1916663 RepID=UPI003F722A9E
MAQILVRNLDEHVKAGLARRAARHGRSLEAEARAILAEAVAPAETGLATYMQMLFADCGLEEPIQEWKGQTIRPAEFD